MLYSAKYFSNMKDGTDNMNCFESLICPITQQLSPHELAEAASSIGKEETNRTSNLSGDFLKFLYALAF